MAAASVLCRFCLPLTPLQKTERSKTSDQKQVIGGVSDQSSDCWSLLRALPLYHSLKHQTV